MSGAGIVFIDKSGNKRAVQRCRDVVMRSSAGVCFAVFACEGQAAIHYGMPVRNMLYDALGYTDQIQQLEAEHKLQGDLLTGDEFLSHMLKDDRLVPIITLTLYYGKSEWNGAKSLYDLLGFSEHSDAIAQLHQYLPDYRLNLIDARHIDDIEHFQTSLQYIFGMLRYNTDKVLLYDYAKIHRDAIREMDDDSIMAMFALLGEQKRLMNIIERERGTGGGFDMCVAIDELISDGETQGRERMSKLVTILLDSNQQALLNSALADDGVRQNLFKQYNI